MKITIFILVSVSVVLNSFFAYKLWLKPEGVQTTQTSQTARDMVVMRTPGGLLEVSTITTEERFDSAANHTVLGVPLGNTVAHVSVPAVYRYHIPLAKDWIFRVTGDALVVVAPQIIPSLPVAIDTGKLQSFSSGLWSPITGQAAVNALQQSITATLGAKAASPQLMQLQRESARQTVSEFVQKWVVQQTRWKGIKAPTVFIFFEDEPLGKKAIPLLSDVS
jgi:hypothetical protein